MGNKIAPRKNMKKLSIILLSIFSFIAFPNLTAAAGTTVDSVSYSCANNEVLRVVYVNGADGKSFAILQQMEEMITMAETISASGAVYNAMDPNYSYTLRTKGSNASLEDSRGTILDGCSE
ncbi:lysozyme [Agrobacterium tumefaciens]|nr:lysozyme [Agrobacterium tumefaciens]